MVRQPDNSHIYRHVTSHFLPTFINANVPSLEITCGDETRNYPDEVNKNIHKRQDLEFENPNFGIVKLTLMECNKVASADLQGRHFVHFIAHDRTVISHPIDGRIGLKFFGDAKDRVFHACVRGRYFGMYVYCKHAQLSR